MSQLSRFDLLKQLERLPTDVRVFDQYKTVEVPLDLFEQIKALVSENETIYTAAHLVPTSWLDPLLTGDQSVLKGNGPWGCPDIERLLNAIRERIATAETKK
jgi:hypothetical protein